MAGRMSAKSIVKSLRKSEGAVLPAVDVVKLSFAELIDLSLGQTEDSANYGAVSFGLLRELLLAIVNRMGMSFFIIRVDNMYLLCGISNRLFMVVAVKALKYDKRREILFEDVSKKVDIFYKH